MTYDILYLIINRCISPLIEGYILLKVSSYLLKKRYDFKYLDLLLIISLAISIEAIIGWNVSKTLYKQILIFLISISIVSINYSGTIFKRIVSYGLLMSIILIGDTLTVLILTSVTDISITYFSTSSYYYAWAVIISKTIQLSFLRFIINKMFKKNKNTDLKYKIEFTLLILFCLLIIFILLEIYQSHAIGERYILKSTVVILATLLLIISIVGISVFYTILKETKKQAEQKQLLEQYQIEQKYSQELINVLENLRILKHDLKNHISCMWGLVETDNIEDLKIYLSNLSNEIKERNLIYIVNEPTISALLNHKFSLARDKTILIDYNINIDEEIRIDKIDLCQVIGNIIDSTIEKIDDLETTSKKMLFNLYTKKNTIYIKVGIANLSEETISLKEKYNKDLRIENVGNIAYKHNGAINYFEQEPSIEVSIMNNNLIESVNTNVY